MIDPDEAKRRSLQAAGVLRNDSLISSKSKGRRIMNYGMSERYIGEKGKDYFSWQNQHAEIGGKVEAHKFAPFIKITDKVLDFGCGGGFTLASIDCAHKEGVDLNTNTHETAQKNGLVVHATTDEVTERNFDVIISNHCLEHVPYPIAALKSLRPLLRKDGKLILVLPLDDWRSGNNRHYKGEDINRHLHTWTPRLLANTLSEAGFKVENIHILTHEWIPKYYFFYGKIPMCLFDALCRVWSFLRCRRQLVAIASNEIP
jgi:2-polyprenyl-3-methyl-5-hydroxy-6-metoxy-1,4-benzoquinol methylase